VGLDERGVDRLHQALHMGMAPIWMYRNLALGRATDQLAGKVLRSLIMAIADQPDGFDVALDILAMRLFTDRSVPREHEPQLIEAGRELLQRTVFRKHAPNRDHRLADIIRACCATPDSGAIAAEVALRLKRAVAASETYWSEHHGLLRALLGVQPTAVLDTLFSGEDRIQKHRGAFDHWGSQRSNPADEISCETLITWCEGDRERRYPLMASFVTFASRSKESGALIWSEQAMALLASAPDPEKVLGAFVERFRPRSWSGSRAALIEANAQLLENSEALIAPASMSFVVEAKARLAQEVEEERRLETERDRERDERFE
jgi:hypothetical protein